MHNIHIERADVPRNYFTAA